MNTLSGFLFGVIIGHGLTLGTLGILEWLRVRRHKKLQEEQKAVMDKIFAGIMSSSEKMAFTAEDEEDLIQ